VIAVHIFTSCWLCFLDLALILVTIWFDCSENVNKIVIAFPNSRLKLFSIKNGYSTLGRTIVLHLLPLPRPHSAASSRMPFWRDPCLMRARPHSPPCSGRRVCLKQCVLLLCVASGVRDELLASFVGNVEGLIENVRNFIFFTPQSLNVDVRCTQSLEGKFGFGRTWTEWSAK
jgi:hypothetical protein